MTITPERFPGQYIRTTVNPEITGQTLLGPAATRISAEDARAMVFDWTGHMPPPVGPEFYWFAGKWGKRYCRWDLGADGWFHLTQDILA